MASTSGTSSSSANSTTAMRWDRAARAASMRGTSATRSVPSTTVGRACRPATRAAITGEAPIRWKNCIGGVTMLPPNSPTACGAVAMSCTVSPSRASSGCSASITRTNSSRNSCREVPARSKPMGPTSRSMLLKDSSPGLILAREVGTKSTVMRGASAAMRARRCRISTPVT